MRELSCKHCGHKVDVGDEKCSGCGIPLPPNLGKHSQLSFKIFFVGVVLFCIFMIIWLPPNWTQFMGINK